MKITQQKRKQFLELERILDWTFGDYSAVSTKLEWNIEGDDDLRAIAEVTFDTAPDTTTFDLNFSLNGKETELCLYEDSYEKVDVSGAVLWKYIAFEATFFR